MDHLSLKEFLAILIAMLGSARIFGWLARKVNQPAVLGELIAGVVVGKSVLGWVDPHANVIHLMAELGVILLLFTIGLETDLKQLLRVGPASAVVALAGVIAPFFLGYGVCKAFGVSNVVAVFAGASLTATSVGITARVLSDLGHLHDTESQVILGAAVIDDVIGLVILSLVSGLASGQELSLLSVGKTTGLAVGFLAVVIVVGRLIVPPVAKYLSGLTMLENSSTIPALLLALGLAWLADQLGSAVILGAFAAGMLLMGTPQHHDIESGVLRLGSFFVPLFFVSVGAAVDLSTINPFKEGSGTTLLISAALICAAVFGKYICGYAAWWFKGNKRLIGVGMIPRGEVGLIFAQMGYSSKVLNEGQFAAVTIVVMATTFIAPPWLKHLLSDATRPGEPEELVAIAELTSHE